LNRSYTASFYVTRGYENRSIAVRRRYILRVPGEICADIRKQDVTGDGKHYGIGSFHYLCSYSKNYIQLSERVWPGKAVLWGK
jgi:hypothetical protein